MGSRAHGGGGTQVVGLKLSLWGWETSIRAWRDGDEHWVEVDDECLGLKKHETSTQRDTKMSVWAWLGWETSNWA